MRALADAVRMEIGSRRLPRGGIARPRDRGRGDGSDHCHRRRHDVLNVDKRAASESKRAIEGVDGVRGVRRKAHVGVEIDVPGGPARREHREFRGQLVRVDVRCAQTK